jgi:hypothetical protein
MLIICQYIFYKIDNESSLTVLRRGNAHHRVKHAVTRLHRQRCRRSTPRFYAAGANGKNMCQCWSARRNATANPLFAGAFAGVGLCFCTSLLAARCPARVARSPRPCPRPRHDRTCLIRCSLLSFFNQCRNRRRQQNNRSNRQRRREDTTNDPNS